MEIPCSVDGCSAVPIARGYCSKHYSRWHRFGDPEREPTRRSRAGSCSVDGCDSAIRTRSLCSVHYQRVLSTGEVGTPQRARRSRQQICGIPRCGEPHQAQGYCERHYDSWRKYGDPLEVSRRRKAEALICSVDGCDRKRRSKGLVDRSSGDGLCGMHYQRMRTHGQLELPQRPLQMTKGYLNKDGYRIVSFGGRVLQQHRLVMEQAIGRQLLPDETVHHKNGVRDDNRLDNLELWSRSQPPGQRVADKVAWARQIIDQYGSLVDEGVVA